MIENKVVCYTVPLPSKYVEGKEELWKLKDFTMQKCNLQKIL